MANPSVSLAVWASAWLAGRAAPDDVIDALIAWAPRHLVTAYDAVAAGHTGLSWPDMDDNGPIGLLQTIRTATGQPHGLPDIHVILPAPGDPRGLPAGTQFQRDAMEASEAIILSDRQNDSTAIGLVPAVEYDEDRDETTGLSWTVYSLPAKIPPQPAQDLGKPSSNCARRFVPQPRRWGAWTARWAQPKPTPCPGRGGAIHATRASPAGLRATPRDSGPRLGQPSGGHRHSRGRDHGATRRTR